MHDLEALGVGLHQAVLDAVVHHLHEMPCTRRAAVQPAVGRSEILERGREVRDRLVGPADHQAVADLVAPDAAGGAGVDEHDAALGQRGRAALAVGEARVAAVDEDVALAQQARELVDRLLGDVPRRHHHPHGAATLAEVRDELGERGRRRAALARERRARPLRAVPRVHLVTGVEQPVGHAGAHAPESDERDLHVLILSVRDVLERSLDRRLAGGHWDARDRQAAAAKRAGVAERLRVAQRAESERASGDRLVVLLARQQLHEHPGRRPALVVLARGVEVARAEPRRDRAAEPIAQAALQVLEQRLALWRGGDERLQADVGAAALGLTKHVAQRSGLLRRELAVAREAVEDRNRAILRLLHVRLVERVDVQASADQRRRDLPLDEERPELGRIAVELHGEHGLPGRTQDVEHRRPARPRPSPGGCG